MPNPAAAESLPCVRGGVTALSRDGGVVLVVTIPQSPLCGDSSLRRARSAALTAHRAVIHYRRLRCAYPLHKGAFGAHQTAAKENLMSHRLSW